MRFSTTRRRMAEAVERDLHAAHLMFPPLPLLPLTGVAAAHAAAALACADPRHAPRFLLIADLRSPATTERLVVIDLRGVTPRVVMRTTVAQGVGGWSNRIGSLASSPGLYAIQKRYVGVHGTAWRLAGLTPGWNSNARIRDVVLHSAAYVGPHHAGRSWGCPAVSPATLSALRAMGALRRDAHALLWIDGPGVGAAAALDCPDGQQASSAQVTF